MKKYPEGSPVVRHRASVLTTDIQVSFYEKHQVDEIFSYLIDKGHAFEFEVEQGDSLTLNHYFLTIKEVSWARNVKELFEELEKLDYNSGDVSDE